MNYLKENNIQLIMGLGNPSKQYTHTYHNAGTLALHYICNHLPDGWMLSEPKCPKKSFISRALIGPDKMKIIVIQPLVFMNESGRALYDALSFFHVSLSRVLVIHDDSDITIGSYKLSYNQRSAGHRGVESIITQCGSQLFFRAKIGIRPTEENQRKKADEFVLKKISKKDMNILENVFSKLLSDMLD